MRVNVVIVTTVVVEVAVVEFRPIGVCGSELMGWKDWTDLYREWQYKTSWTLKNIVVTSDKSWTLKIIVVTSDRSWTLKNIVDKSNTRGTLKNKIDD